MSDNDLKPKKHMFDDLIWSVSGGARALGAYLFVRGILTFPDDYHALALLAVGYLLVRQP